VVNYHADDSPAAAQNTRDLLKAMQGAVGTGLVVGGDFNAAPDGEGPQAALAAGLIDMVVTHDASSTWSDRRYDYLFTDARLSVQVMSARVVNTDRSDHRPVVMDLNGELSGAF
jgi:endonuclease/exonuclease/phosphatase (EEP) superfamily protein YafD